jgi:hypothetical protein
MDRESVTTKLCASELELKASSVPCSFWKGISLLDLVAIDNQLGHPLGAAVDLLLRKKVIVIANAEPQAVNPLAARGLKYHPPPRAAANEFC